MTNRKNRYARLQEGVAKDIEKAEKKNRNHENTRFFKSLEEAMAVRDKLEKEGKGNQLSVIGDDEDEKIILTDIVLDGREERVVILCEDGKFRPYGT